MSAIKLPVRAVYPWDCLEFLDAEGQPVAPEDIAAALNAAPTRAFGELTPKMIGLMVNDVVREVGERHENATVQEYSDWQKRCDEAMLSRLQAFAAPLHTVAVVRAEARREALEEAAKACALLAESFTGHVAAGALQCGDAIRALIDQPAPAPVGPYMGSDDSDCGNG